MTADVLQNRVVNGHTYAVPFDSLSGNLLLRLQEKAYRTQLVFEKYFVVPLIVICSIPFLAVLDCCAQIGKKGTPSDHWQDAISHVVSVIALPFRLISYWFCCQQALLAVRSSPAADVHMLAEITKQPLSPEFIQHIYRQMPISAQQQAEMKPRDRILYRIVSDHNNLALAQKYWTESSSVWAKSAFIFAMEKNDLGLINDVVNIFESEIEQKFLPYCVEQGGNAALPAPIQQRYRERALTLFRRVDIGNHSLRWLETAIATNQVELIREVSNFRHINPVRVKLAAHVVILIEKMMLGEMQYQEIVQFLLLPQQNLFNFLLPNHLVNECRGVIARWVAQPQCLDHLGLMRSLLSIAYSRVFQIDSSTLFGAMSHRNLALFDLFLEYANPNVLNGNISALEMAFSNPRNRLEFTTNLCRKRVNVDIRFAGVPDLRGHTPLTYAASIGEIDLVRLLLANELERGTPSAHPNYNGKTAFQIAQDRNDRAMVELLREPGLFADFFPDAIRNLFRNRAAPPEPAPEANPPANENGNVFNRLVLNCLNLQPIKPELTEIMNRFRRARERGNYWIIFNSEVRLDAQVLNREYRRLSVIVHPDRNGDEQATATAMFAALTAAKDYLS
jgi:hypothetical protein